MDDDGRDNDSIPKIDPEYRLTKDLRASAALIGRDEARYLVDTYYAIQKFRLGTGNQKRDLVKAQEPHALIQWTLDTFERFEGDVKKALAVYAASGPLGQWALSIHAIGPVITAGLLAHISIELFPCAKCGTNGKEDGGSCQRRTPSCEGVCKPARVQTAGQIWRFAGLDDPKNYDWSKGKKRPWNASLKVLCWKIGESFCKLRGYENDIYGKVYAERKAEEIERNERGDNAEEAARTLASKKYGPSETRTAYEAGRLPDGRIDLRAKRVAVKLFLAHYHHVAYELRYGEPPPLPYIIAHGNHTHFIGPPKWPV